MSRLLRFLPIFCLLFAAACTMEVAIERLSTPEDRAFARRFVENVRTGNEEALKPLFEADLWTRSRGDVARARTLYPPGEGTTRLIGYHIATNVTGSGTTTRKEYVLVTTDQTHWTTTKMVTLARGGPAQVVAWNVVGSGEKPPELEMYESMERIAPFLQAGAVILLLAAIALVWWLVRRSRRKAAARA